MAGARASAQVRPLSLYAPQLGRFLYVLLAASIGEKQIKTCGALGVLRGNARVGGLRTGARRREIRRKGWPRSEGTACR